MLYIYYSLLAYFCYNGVFKCLFAGTVQANKMSKITVILIGHSFVRRVKIFLQNIIRENHIQLPVESYAPQYFGLDHFVEQIIFDGESGAGVMDDFTIPNFKLKNHKPHVAVVELASNDVARGFSVKSICAALIDTALMLRDRYAVQQIVVCSCLRRNRRIGALNPSQFDDLAGSLNRLLRDASKAIPEIHYHTHRGFWNYEGGDLKPVSEWSSDGIHPTTDNRTPLDGMNKYITSLRRAIYEAIKRLPDRA